MRTRREILKRQKCPEGCMLQTTLRTDSGSDSECIVVPLGLVRLVRAGMRRFGFDRLLDGFKADGVPLSLVAENLIISCLGDDYSMADWDRYVNRSELRRSYFCGPYTVRYWTMQRGLETLGIHLEEIVDHVTRVTRVAYPDMPTHAYVDGSHLERFGPKGKNVKYGEGGGSVQLQDQFVASSLVGTGTPVSVELYPGNENDPQQYGDFIPQLLFHLKRGSMIVMDNGGASSSILDEIVQYGDAYLVRMRLNASDIMTIKDGKDRMVYVGMNAACIMHTFESSDRTTYLYFSADSYAAEISRAEKTVRDLEAERRRAQTVLERGDPMKAISVKATRFYTVRVNDAELVMLDDPWVDIDPRKALKDAISPKGGWFKLECPFPMDPRLALVIYRHRVDVEYMISCLKSVINMDPMRVWTVDSSRGKLALGLMAQFILSAAVYEMEPIMAVKTVDGRETEVPTKPSYRTVTRELDRYEGVVRRFGWGGFEVESIRDSTDIDGLVAVIDRYEREPPLPVDADEDVFTKPTGEAYGRKYFQNLAVPISQWFEKEVYPEFMKGRRHWKDIDSGSFSVYSDRGTIDPASPGAPGLKGRRPYYPLGPRRSGRNRHTAK